MEKDEVIDRTPAYRENGAMRWDATAKEIVSHVARRTFISLRPISKAKPSKKVGWSIKYITVNYGKSLQLGQIAKSVGLSKYHFLRKFREEVGMTPGMFLRRYRVYMAMEKLANSRAGIGAIAKAVGYQDPAAFSRAFLKVMGTPPFIYRQKQQRSSVRLPQLSELPCAQC